MIRNTYSSTFRSILSVKMFNHYERNFIGLSFIQVLRAMNYHVLAKNVMKYLLSGLKEILNACPETNPNNFLCRSLFAYTFR